MEIINLQIKRIVIHQIHQREPDGKKVMPSRSSELIRFDEDAMNTFKSRVIAAIGLNSKAVLMSIFNQEPDSLPSLVSRK